MGLLLTTRYFYASTSGKRNLIILSADETRRLALVEITGSQSFDLESRSMSQELNDPNVMNNLTNDAMVLGGAALGTNKNPARETSKSEVSVSLNAPLKRPVMEEHDAAVLAAQNATAQPVVIVVGAKTAPVERLQLAKEEVSRALEQAQAAVLPFLLHRELKAARAELAKAPDSEGAQQKVAKLSADLQKCGQGKYAQTTKAIHAYASAVHKCLECFEAGDARDAFLSDSVKIVETLMCGPDNLFKGIPGKTPDIPRFADKEMSQRERLEQLEIHLREKINKMDGDQAQRIRKVESLPVIVNLLNRTSVFASRFAEDAVFFFDAEGLIVDGKPLKEGSDFSHFDLDKVNGARGGTVCGAIVVKPERTPEGKLVELPERNGFRMSRPVFARKVIKVLGVVPDTLVEGSSFDLANDAFAVFFREDGTLVLDHGTDLPKPVDIVRLRKSGVGPEGGGFHRFIDENLVGMAIVMKKYTPNGQPLQIRGTNGLIAKEVVEVIGKIPSRTVQTASGVPQEIPLVKAGTSYGNLLKTFRERNKLLAAAKNKPKS